MQFILLTLLTLFQTIYSNAQSANPLYDKHLADSLGGDEYGMKSYVLVILKTGSNKTTNGEMLDSLFRGHMANINRLANMKKLIVAGPLKKNERAFRGIFIMDVKSIDEARLLAAPDPAIEAKILEPEFFTWYGSAALPMYLPDHEKIEKNKIE